MKVFDVMADTDLNSCIEKDPKDVLIWLEESEPGAIITIDVMEMSEEEYNALPEYMGP